MAHIEKRRRRSKDGTLGPAYYRARFVDDDGRERSRTFSRKVEAETWLDTIRGDLARGVFTDPAGGRRQFGEYAEEWRATRVHRASTQVQVETNLRRHVLPFLGHRPLGAIRPTELQAWVRNRSDVLAPATLTTVYRYVSGIFSAAVADRLIPSSPCVGVALPKRERRRLIPLETEQVRALIEAVPDRYRALVVLGAGTGLRQGEAFGLTIEHVNLLGRRLDVAQQLVLLPHHAPTLAPPKTEASFRSIPLPGVVIDELAAHLAKYPTSASEPRLIFTGDNGAPISRTKFSARVWRPAIKATSLPTGVGFHALRHYYASLLIRHGESVKVVQSRLGHASASETIDTYSHLWPDSEDRTREAIDAMLRTRPDQPVVAALRQGK